MQKIKILSLLLTVLISTSVFSQKRKEKIEYLSNFDLKTVRWGFYFGINDSDFKVSYKGQDLYGDMIDGIHTKTSIGFNIGLLGDLRLHNNINLRLEPGLYYSKKDIIYTYFVNDNDRNRTAKSTFLYVPILLQFSTDRIRNIRPYAAGGLAYGHNFTSHYEDTSDNADSQFRLNKNVYFYELAMGMDFYFYFFKFSPSIRGVFSINNEMKYDKNPDSPWTAPVDFMGTRAIFLRLSFQ
jgi:hypothetical protein